MRRMNPYPEYKESGSDLIGKIPTDWEITRMRSAVDMKKNQVGLDWDQYLLLSLTLQGVIPRDLENRMGKMPADFTTYQAVERDDLIFCLFDVEETPRTVGWVPERGMMTGAYTAATVRSSFHSKFVAYHYLSFDQRKAYRRFYAGLRNTIRAKDFYNIPLAYPSMAEQQAIASFLDHETADIDAFIGDQEELVVLLNERRAATITQAVTKGISTSQVQSWRTTRLRYEVALNPTPPLSVRNQPDSELSFLPMDAIGDRGELDLSRTRLIRDVLSGYSYFENGDVSFAKVTPCFENGKGAVFQDLKGDAGFGTTELTVARVRSGLYPSFLYFVFQSHSFRQGGIASMTGAGGLKRVPDGYVRDYQLALPSIEEQQAIVSWLVDELDEIDAAIADAKESIKLSKERRAALISAAVTGKIDVRNHTISELGVRSYGVV